MIEVDRIDVRQVDERLDLDRAGLARLDGAELLVADHHLLAVEVVAVADLLPHHLGVFLGAEAPLLDALAVLLVKLVEVQIEVANAADELDGHVDEPEAQRTAPQRPRHQPVPRLASSAAIRSSPCSGSSCATRSISSPFALRLMSPRTESL